MIILKNSYKYLVLCLSFVSLVILPFTNIALAIEYKEVKTISLQAKFKTKEKWYVTVYEDARAVESAQIESARICFGHDPAKKQETCVDAADEHRSGEEHYDYPQVKEFGVVKLQNNMQGILFVADNTYFDVGSISLITIWSYNKKEDKFENILITGKNSEQSEFQIIPAMKGIKGGLFVVAGFIWGKDESRYEKHHYRISIYRIDDSNKYSWVGGYKTKKKYKSLDDVDKIEVIKYEQKNILKFVKSIKGNS